MEVSIKEVSVGMGLCATAVRSFGGKLEEGPTTERLLSNSAAPGKYGLCGISRCLGGRVP